MKQALGPLGEVDIPTSKEMQDAMGHALNPVINALRGEKLMRMPTARVVATAATQALSATPPGAPIGPESGYMWRIARLIVVSASLVDTAKYVLYEGSDVTDFSPIRVMDAVNGGATPGQNVNVGYNPGSKGLWLFNDEQIYAQIFGATVGTTYILKGVIAQVPQEMQGKLI